MNNGISEICLSGCLKEVTCGLQRDTEIAAMRLGVVLVGATWAGETLEWASKSYSFPRWARAWASEALPWGVHSCQALVGVEAF